MSSEHKISKRGSGRNCCVPNCGNNVYNTRGKIPKVSFYSFPNDVLHGWKKERRQKWINAVRLVNPDGSKWEPTKYSYVCSEHFVDGKKSDHPLSPSYVPSIFPKIYKKKSVVSSDRFRRSLARVQKKSAQNLQEAIQGGKSDIRHEIDMLSISTTFDNSSNAEKHTTDDGNISPTWFDNSDATTEETPVIRQTAEIGIQVEFPGDVFGSETFMMCNRLSDGAIRTAEIQVCIPHRSQTVDSEKCEGFHGMSSIKNDDEMNSLCGVTLAVFTLILRSMPRPPNKKLSIKNKLMVFFMKLKLGLSFASLAVLFGVHRSTISRSFFYILGKVDTALRPLIFMPPQNIVFHLAPKCFKVHYPKCRAIIDCTEMKIENPPRTDQQVLTYSNYKKGNTLKFLIACTPHGQICFVSRCYGGRSSDSFITTDSGFLDLIEPGDQILADKGFPIIQSELESDKIIVTPPFAFNEQFTKEEMDKTYKIASVRIHIERCIQRVKIFQILKFIPVELIPYSSRIVRICCALVNLQPPIINEK